MSNHFHILLHAPAQAPSPEEMCRRYRAFHRGQRTLEPDSPACRAWQARSRDVSWFMRHLQQLFTIWYNRTRPLRRRGSLWAAHFKQVGGIEIIGLGSDFDGIGGKLELSDCSKMPLLADALRKEGFTEDEVEAIFFRNAQRFFENNL